MRENLKNSIKILLLFIISVPVFRGSSSTYSRSAEISLMQEMKTLFIPGDGENVDLKNGVYFYYGKPFSGTIISLFDNNETASISSFLNGKEHGKQIKWNRNRNKMEERYYEFGKKEGIHTGWYENGSFSFLYNFENGEYRGNQKEWYPNGQMYKDFNYVNGYESGMQTAWEITGKLLANYDVKNGRKYGLIGTHNCKSLWDEKSM